VKKTLLAGVGVFLLAALPLGAADKDKDKDAKDDKFDAAKLVGTWKYVSGEKNGEKSSDDQLKKDSVVITKDTFTLKGDDTFVMKYTLDAKKTPIGISFKIVEGPFGKDATAEGIIELKGDDLKVCYNPEDGGKAPEKFEAKEGSKFHCFVLKRSK
jgi:uncharacterized protein (TIGR03067 family)